MSSDCQKTLVTLAAGMVLGAAMSIMAKKSKVPSLRNLPRNLPKMTLHVYDHCPFCVKVELVLGWKELTYERKVYGYGDSLGDPEKGLYDSGVRLTGKKQLPVLEVEGKFIPESNNIISYLEGMQGPGKVLLPPLSGRKDLNDFFSSKGKFKKALGILTRPEKIKMTHLTDWSRSEDIKYAKAKYEAAGFDYAAAEAAKEENITIMNSLLEELDGMVYSNEALTGGPCGLSWDDVVYLPQIRTLTMVEGLTWPKKLRAYTVNTLYRGNASSYFF